MDEGYLSDCATFHPGGSYVRASNVLLTRTYFAIYPQYLSLSTLSLLAAIMATMRSQAQMAVITTYRFHHSQSNICISPDLYTSQKSSYTMYVIVGRSSFPELVYLQDDHQSLSLTQVYGALQTVGPL